MKNYYSLTRRIFEPKILLLYTQFIFFHTFKIINNMGIIIFLLLYIYTQYLNK